MDRRKFINLSFQTSSSFVLGLNSPFVNIVQSKQNGQTHLFGRFLEITEDGQIIFYVPIPEIGQGIATAFAMIIAEELDADWSQIMVKQAKASDKFEQMSAAGSTSVEFFFRPLREAGAVAKQMLKTAASVKWGVPLTALQTNNSLVIHENKKITYAELVASAAGLDVPRDVTLKKHTDFRIIGKAGKTVNLHNIVTGKSIFGIDVSMDGMKYATVERCPVRGGKLISYDPDEALLVDGVVDIFEIKPYAPIPYAEVLSGVAIIANDTFSALQARKLLKVNWDYGTIYLEDSKEYRRQYEELKNQEPEILLREISSTSPQIDETADVLDFNFEIPFWAHYCMEPMNFTAHVTSEKCFLKGPNQTPQLIQDLASQVLGLPKEKVDVITTLSGGGFGRRLAIDYALEALVISKKSGYPVKLIWTREDDVLHDYFRTVSFHHLRIGIEKGALTNWFHHIITKPIDNGPRYEVQGAADIPFQIPNIRIGYSKLRSGVRIGSWRSVAHSFNSFVVNYTLTEVANHLNKDLLAFYIELMGSQENITINLPLRGSKGRVHCDLKRLKSVLQKAAELAQWGATRKKSTALGLACAFYKRSYAAHVVEVSNASGKTEINKITAVLDCGQVINPLGVKAQMEGSISDAITVTLKSCITIEKGRPKEINYDTHKVTRLADMPQLQLHLMESQEAPGGAGEPPFPSVAPAIASAIFRLTGNRIRKLPISI